MCIRDRFKPSLSAKPVPQVAHAYASAYQMTSRVDPPINTVTSSSVDAKSATVSPMIRAMKVNAKMPASIPAVSDVVSVTIKNGMRFC